MRSADSTPANRRLVALYPGSFDPVHNGHVDVVEQAAELFGDVLVVAMYNPSKAGGTFAIDERVNLLRQALAHVPQARVEAFAGLAVDAAKHFDASFLVKGLRNAADFDVEQQMAQTNHAVSGVRTVYVPCRPDQVFISSRFIREIAHYGGDVSQLVPTPVVDALARLRAVSTTAESPKATP